MLTTTIFSPGFDVQTIGSVVVSAFTLSPALTFDGLADNLYLLDNPGLRDGNNIYLLRLSRLSGSAASPVWSTWTGSTILDNSASSTGLFPVANNFSFVQLDAAQRGVAETCAGGPNDGDQCRTSDDCPQPHPPTIVAACRRLDTGDPRIGNVVYRNGRVWGTHSAGLPAGASAQRTAVFWYAIDPAIVAGSPIVQSGVVDPGIVDGHHFYPSISVNQPGKVYYGDVSLHEVFERTAWHCGQHTRQLMLTLEKLGIAPMDPLTDADFAGLPMPSRVWDNETSFD
jgi:hypothetical protein